jgi:hypothetical protein
MAKKSGGVTARNTRQGFRSEYIARYIFSAFGTAVEVSQGNDIGLDILCNLTSFNGLLIFYKSSYGVQVKSNEDDFVYTGKQATTWLSMLEYPLLLASVDKKSGRIKIYSTWNLNRFLLSLHTNDENSFPDQIKFITSDDDQLGDPELNGNIPVGKPILDFEFSDIDDPEKYDAYYKVLDEWLEFDNRNYSLRRAGVPLTFGYIKWETNKGLDASMRIWHKATYYSPFHTDKIKNLMAQALIPLGMYNKDNFKGSTQPHFKDEFNDIKKFIDKYLTEFMDDWGKGVFDNDL